MGTTKTKKASGKAGRIGLRDWRGQNGLLDDDNFLSFLEEVDGSVSALCEDGCEVEPDGTCPHGHPSVVRAAGYV